jgi:heavy metal sensor kinase
MKRLSTIRIRLTLWYTALLAITVLGFSFYLDLELQDSLGVQIDAGLQVAASQLLVDVDDSVNPPRLRPMSDAAADHILQSSFAIRMVTPEGEVIADVGDFPDLAFAPPASDGFTDVEIQEVHWRVYTQRVETNNVQYDVWLQVGQTLNIVDETQRSLLRLILFGLPAVLIVTALGGTFMAHRALNPVDNITRTVQEINATDLTKRIHYKGAPDELGRLTETLNSMLDRLQAAFDTEKRFTADASHELRTPLTAIKGQINVTLTRQRTPQEYESTLHHIQQETDRLIRLANDLLFLARLDASPLYWQPESVDLSHLVEAVIDQIEIIAAEKGITLSAEIPDGVTLQGITDHLIRLFLNIVENAVKYTPTGGTVHVSMRQNLQDVHVVISDSGQGISAEHLPHLFERFYRVDRERSQNSGGAGLGLAIAYQIALAHGSGIQIQSVQGQGTKVIVSLPLASSAEK